MFNYFNTLDMLQNPKYNFRKIDDSQYQLQVNVAGFEINDLEVTLDDGVLNIKGDQKSKEQYIYRGLSNSINYSFDVSDLYDVVQADVTNGILNIILQKPESKRAKRIQIGDTKQLLFG